MTDRLTRIYNSWVHEQNGGAGCERCVLHKCANGVVFGDGDPTSKLVVIGEAPGEQEDRWTTPLVGPAGQLLRKEARKAGVDFGDIDLRLRSPETASCVVTWGCAYMTNVVACRPPDNRAPMFDEIGACRTRLEAIMAAIKPRAILILGAVALTALTGKLGITKARGQRYPTKWRWRGGLFFIEAMATFHPAGLLPGRIRDPGDLAKFREDIKAAYDRAYGE
jgi:uracil-DNA glycosylase